VSGERIAIAIPFHRGLSYLKSAIESVLAQTRGEWLLVVRDDRGEPNADAVSRLVRSFADPRIRYDRNPENLGMVANWNRCLDEAETDLVTLLHADDRLLPHYVATMLDVAGAYPDAAAFFCRAQIIGTKGERRFSLPDFAKRLYSPRGRGPIVLRGETALGSLMAGNFIMCPTLCLRRSVLGARCFEKGWSQVQDLEFTGRLLLEGELLVGSRSVAYAYRRHEESATTRQSESLLRFEEEFALFEQIASRAEALGWLDAASISRRARIVKLHLAVRALEDLFAARPRRALTKMRLSLRRSLRTREEDEPSSGV